MRNLLVRGFRRLLRPIFRRQPETVRDAARNLLNEIHIAREVSRASHQLTQLESRRDLKLQLGCGGEIKPGWVNIDLMPTQGNLDVNGSPSEGTLLINYDLRRGTLPLADNSCEIIYSSHFFEHLTYKNGLALMRDCYRVLNPGGIFRISLPNFRGLFRAYLEGDLKHLDLVNINEVLPEVEPGTETIVDYVNYGVYQYGEHKCVYDEEKVLILLGNIGFSKVSPSEFKEGIDPANELRRRYSFYVEAVK